MIDDYKTDLTPAEEHLVLCARHPHRRAEMYDIGDDGEKIACCHICWSARWPKIRQRLAEQRLILGGLSNERTV